MDITTLSGLTHLGRLDLFGNHISDVTPLVVNTGINERDHVGICGNLLDCQDSTTLTNLATLAGRVIDLYNERDDTC